MDGDSNDSLEWMASREVCVRAIGDNKMNGRHRWWTHGGALVSLWDSGHRSTMNKWKKEHRQLYCINGADYGHDSSLEVGLCKVSRQEQWRWLQEWMEMMRSA
jgi:hypothetical protein